MISATDIHVYKKIFGENTAQSRHKKMQHVVITTNDCQATRHGQTPGREGGTPYNGSYGEALPERGTFVTASGI